jgi:hypothetical protein
VEIEMSLAFSPEFIAGPLTATDGRIDTGSATKTAIFSVSMSSCVDLIGFEEGVFSFTYSSCHPVTSREYILSARLVGGRTDGLKDGKLELPYSSLLETEFLCELLGVMVDTASGCLTT